MWFPSSQTSQSLTGRPSLALSGPCVMEHTPSTVPRRSACSRLFASSSFSLKSQFFTPPLPACSPYFACFTVLHPTIASRFIHPCPFGRLSWPSCGATTPIPFYRSAGLYPPGELIDLLSRKLLLSATRALSLYQFNKDCPPTRSPRQRAPFERLLGICRGQDCGQISSLTPFSEVENPRGCTN